MKMRQCRALIVNENFNGLDEFNEAYIVSLSKTDSDNLKLLKQYLPEDLNKEFTEQEKEAIRKYNSYIDVIKSKSRSSAIQIDFGLKKIKV